VNTIKDCLNKKPIIAQKIDTLTGYLFFYLETGFPDKKIPGMHKCIPGGI